MKKITFSFLFILTFICSSVSFGQTRYLDPVFPSVDTTNNIVYAVNQSVLLGEALPVATGATVPIGIDSITDPNNPTPIFFTMPSLELDVFQPSGDTEAERPLIIYLHTGTFAPIIRNGAATGNRSIDYATQVFCNQYAARGYVVANTDYRLGWNPALPTEAERASSLMKAAYRGIQDVKAAIRFFRMDYENGNTYGIDTSRIIICGQGTGGWIATCLNSVDKLSEIQLPKFLDPVTALPLIDTAVMGDWFGYGGNPAYNTPSNVGYSSEHDMILNMGGAIGDLSWLEAGDKPIAAVHGNLDAVARFTTGNLSVSGINIVSSISGSHDVVSKADMLGNNSAIPNLFDPYTLAAKAASNSIVGSLDFSGETVGPSVDNLFPFVTGNPGEGSPWDYFDSATCVGLAQLQGLPASAGTDAYMSSLATNPNVSMAKANAYIDSTLGFFCPRIVNTLMLPGNSVGVEKKNVSVNVYPNPTTDYVSFNSSSNIQSITIFDNNGKLINSFNPNRFTFTVNVSNFAKGIYHAEISNGNVIRNEKFIVE
jgi:acetyl esterase/lipase